MHQALAEASKAINMNYIGTTLISLMSQYLELKGRVDSRMLFHPAPLKLQPVVQPSARSVQKKPAASTILFSLFVCDGRSSLLPRFYEERVQYKIKASAETTAVSTYVMAAGRLFISWLVEAVTNH